MNWDNPEVRRAVFEMMNFWADKGVAGFRLDVINLISRTRLSPRTIATVAISTPTARACTNICSRCTAKSSPAAI